MGKPNLSRAVRSVQTTVVKHSPEILTGLGVAGMITAVVMAVRATPKALSILDNAAMEDGTRLKRPEDIKKYQGGGIVDLPKRFYAKDLVKLTWKCYIPTAATSAVSIACLVGASRVNMKRNAALATAYTLSETALREYQEKVIETIGEKKEQTVRDKVAKEQVDKNPVSNNEIIITNKGDTLFYELTSKRYFKSDIEKIRKVENILNKRLMNEMWVTLNELYYELGLSGTALGEEFGWDVDKGFIELNFSAQLTEEEQPCIAIGHMNPPNYRMR